ncbi:DUF1285 domain-containing protein [Salinarimonas ramus]|uniref:DUF1285 domain-containing protein n=1 Tax=Salinarimonas ramus TaxID=690164 RepID=A0A917Q9N4_9HYPH|nr:DUF1285 domain-containing protein [Salinarimonas ramus]GGK37396.1 hypothetical protein GCM10011322_25570 [Salinarimonas ramus]
MADHEFETGADAPVPDALARLVAAAKEGRGAPPVERWNPEYCGEIDMRIAADGTWFYQGTPIGRPALVKLFASVLRKDPERFVLVTPVERVGIAVEDAPFLAVEMAVEGDGDAREIAFRTNVDDVVKVDAEHPLVFARDAHGGVKPYLRVRGGLDALVTRALAYDLAELAELRRIDGREVWGVAAGGGFWEMMEAHEAG